MPTAPPKSKVCEIRKHGVCVSIFRNGGAFLGQKRSPYFAKGRIQIKRAKLENAKEEARKLCEKIASGQTAQLSISNESAAVWGRIQRACENMGKTPEAVVLEYKEAFMKLRQPFTVVQACEDFAQRNNTPFVPKTLGELIEPFMEEKEQKDRTITQWHLYDLKNRLARAAAHFPEAIHLIDRAGLGKGFLYALRDKKTGQRLSPQSIVNYHAALTNFFNSETARKHLPTNWNEMALVERPKVPDRQSVYFDVEELRLLLYGAEGHVELPTAQAIEQARKKGETITPPTPQQKENLRSLMPVLIMGAFGSTRNCISRGEITRLDWQKLDFKKNYIRLTDPELRIAKIGQRNNKMNEAFLHWITPYIREEGAIVPPNAKKIRALLCKLTGIKWKWNGLRKTCLTHNRALTGDSAKVAELAGNSVAMVKKHYTEPLDLEDGEKWASLRRPDQSNVVQLVQTESNHPQKLATNRLQTGA